MNYSVCGCSKICAVRTRRCAVILAHLLFLFANNIPFIYYSTSQRWVAFLICFSRNEHLLSQVNQNQSVYWRSFWFVGKFTQLLKFVLICDIHKLFFWSQSELWLMNMPLASWILSYNTDKSLISWDEKCNLLLSGICSFSGTLLHVHCLQVFRF